MTVPSTFGPVYPQLDANGVSLVVYAEDGVTVIPPVTGAVVPNTKYYTDLVRLYGQLTLSNPLESSGDPISIPPTTRASAGLVGIVTTQLAARAILLDGEIVTTSGYAAIGDGGGATFGGVLGASSGADTYTKINTANGQWQMLLNYGQLVNVRQLGCIPDGSFPCAARINSFLSMWLSTYGAGANLTLDVPPIARSTAGGYRLESPGIKIPGQLSLCFRTDGPSYVDGLLWSVSTTGCTRSGAVFVADVGVTAFSKLTPADGTYPTVKFVNIAILGPGGAFTAGHGIDCATGFVATCDKLHIGGFNVGYFARSVVSVHKVDCLKCTGNIEGIHLGTTAVNHEFVDGEFISYDASYNQAALVVEVAREARFYGGLIQSNYNGVVLGNNAGTHNMRGIHLGFNHYEVNGDDNGPVAPWAAGGKHVVVKSGGTIDTVEFHMSTAGGTLVPAALPRDISIPAGAGLRFDHTFMGGRLTVASGAYVELLHATTDAGFTSFTIGVNATVSRLARGIGVGLGLSGSYTHDWMAAGPIIDITLAGALNILGVDNMPNGAEMTFVFSQDAIASRVVTWGGSFRMDAWNSTGFAVATAKTSITFVNKSGALVQCAPQPAFGWLP